MLLESLAECRVGVIAGGQCDLGDIHGSRAQFPARPQQAHPSDIPGWIFARVPGEHPVEVWNGDTRDPRKDAAVERFAQVLADIALYGFDFVRLGL